jgi:hypothetical protein
MRMLNIHFILVASMNRSKARQEIRQGDYDLDS